MVNRALRHVGNDAAFFVQLNFKIELAPFFIVHCIIVCVSVYSSVFLQTLSYVASAA